MADELEILTENAASDGWVDSSPSAISTGYQAQNTNIQARSLGQDLTYVRVSDDDIGVTLEICGPVDDGGVPFKLGAETTLYPDEAGTWYVAVTAGSTDLLRTVELVQGTPAFDSTEGVLKIDDDRILNWTINYSGTTVTVAELTPKAALGSFDKLSSPYGYIRYLDYQSLFWTAIRESFDSPSTAPTGLTFDGTNLISCDEVTETIYIHDGISDTILSSFSSPLTQPSGLTYDGTNLISCDAFSGYISIHDGITNTILSSFEAADTSPSGLAFDGTNLIAASTLAESITVYDGTTSTVLSSFSAPSDDPTGLTFGGTNLISCSSTSGLIYTHDGISDSIISNVSSPSTQPSGLTYDGTTLISCDETSATIYIHGITF